MATKPETIELIRNTCSNFRGARILDLGCGDRSYEKFVGGENSYIGIDVEDSGRDESGKNPDFFYDGVNIPLDNETIDIILFLEVLEHVVCPEKLLPEINRVLKHGGLIIFSIPFIWPLHEEPYDFRRMTVHGVKSLFNSLQFEILSFEKLYSGWSGLSKLLDSQALQNRKNYMIIKFMALCARLLSRLNINGLEKFYLTNLVLAKKN